MPTKSAKEKPYRVQGNIEKKRKTLHKSNNESYKNILKEISQTYDK